VGIALGDAFAAKFRGEHRIAVAFFGDGGINTGRTWEFLNLASAWELPLVAVCENNLYAVETPTASVSGGGSMTQRAESFGLTALSVDGKTCLPSMKQQWQRASEQSPVMGQLLSKRVHTGISGHGSGEGVGAYRSAAEIADWRRARDPITRCAGRLREMGALAEGDLEVLDKRATEIVDAAVLFAEESPWPETF